MEAIRTIERARLARIDLGNIQTELYRKHDLAAYQILSTKATIPNAISLAIAV